MTYAFRHPFKTLKEYLPKSLFGRSLLILVMPLVLIETISAYVFFDNHWDRVTQALANDIAGDIATLTELYRADPSQENTWRSVGGKHLELRMEFLPHQKIERNIREEWQDSFIDVALKSHIFVPYTFVLNRKDIVVDVEVGEGVLRFETPRKRLQNRSFMLFILWVAGTSAFFLFVAAIFMHNQVKPLRRLAIAADRFGKGRPFATFRSEGAIEIRKLAHALNIMKERLSQQLSQKSEMLAGVSHDLRTPLTRMRLQLEMMKSSREVIGLQQDVNEMSAMIDEYLTFARGEGMEEPVETEMTDLCLAAVNGRADLNIVVHYAAISLPPLHVRQQAVKRCLMNLINNATRYGHEVWVTTEVDEDSMRIFIEDNGPGIPEDKLQDVFRPFFRLDASRNIATGGVGLGLSIAKDVARAHGGDVVLSSSPLYGGLRACIVLPV